MVSPLFARERGRRGQHAYRDEVLEGDGGDTRGAEKDELLLFAICRRCKEADEGIPRLAVARHREGEGAG